MTNSSCLKILCSGELGLTRDAQTIADATVWLADDPRFSLTFVGGGAWWETLKRVSSALLTSNFKFESGTDAPALSQHLASCDIGLVTQCPAAPGPSVSGMTYEFMAAARPILFIGPRDAVPARNIERFGCGWRVEPTDAAGLMLLLEVLAAQPELVRRAGRRAYAAFQQHHFFVPARENKLCQANPIPKANTPLSSPSPKIEDYKANPIPKTNTQEPTIHVPSPFISAPQKRISRSLTFRKELFPAPVDAGGSSCYPCYSC